MSDTEIPCLFFMSIVLLTIISFFLNLQNIYNLSQNRINVVMDNKYSNLNYSFSIYNYSSFHEKCDKIKKIPLYISTSIDVYLYEYVFYESYGNIYYCNIFQDVNQINKQHTISRYIHFTNNKNHYLSSTILTLYPIHLTYFDDISVYILNDKKFKNINENNLYYYIHNHNFLIYTKHNTQLVEKYIKHIHKNNTFHNNMLNIINNTIYFNLNLGNLNIKKINLFLDYDNDNSQ